MPYDVTRIRDYTFGAGVKDLVSRLRLVAFLGVAAVSVSAAAAQRDTVRIPYSVTCVRCRVVAETILAIGGARDPHSLSGLPPVVDSKGRIYGIAFDGASVLAYDATGRFVKAIGRPGEGPGEFAGMGGATSLMLGAGDTLYVVDAQRRVSVFSSDLVFARSFRLPVGRGAAAAQDGRIIAAGIVNSPRGAGYPLHILTSKGHTASSFGTAAPVARPNGPTEQFGLFKLSADDQFVWRRGRLYTFERVGIGTTPRNTLFIVERVPWILRPDSEPVPSPSLNDLRAALDGRGRGSGPAINLMKVDAEGLLWIHVAHGAGAALQRRLEIIDPASRSLLLSQPWAADVSYMAHSDRVFIRGSAPDGERIFTLLRLRLVGR